jgi:hypothetical protein
MRSKFPLQRARAFVARLDVDVGAVPICYACLSFVSFPLDLGDEREAVLWARRMTPDLWHEGLAEYAFAALADARERGLRDAEAALAELEEKHGRSSVARALVLALAADLAERSRVENEVASSVRPRLALAPPELN